MTNERKDGSNNNRVEVNRGHRTSVEFIFLRHSQKQSGLIYADAGSGLSSSSISQSGQARAEKFGKEFLMGKDISQAYGTKYERTKETLAAALNAAGIQASILPNSDNLNHFFSLPESSGSSEIENEYERRTREGREALLERDYPGKEFSDLNPDEQEIIAEIVEEPVIEWYLSFGDKRPDPDTPSTREDAASVAFKISSLINLVDFIGDGDSMNLISCGHKASTEAFLKYVIIQPNGKTGFSSLEEIGGSLHILDSWSLFVQNDDMGNKKISLTIRRENGDFNEYDLDVDMVRELSEEHVCSQN